MLANKQNALDCSLKMEKERLKRFISDLGTIGTLKGFQYFSLYLRGKEELILRVQNDFMGVSLEKRFGFVTGKGLLEEEASEKDEEEDSSLTFDEGLPRNCQSMILSKSTQKSLSGFHFLEIGLPPASPCQNEVELSSPDATVYLLAAYARYRCPYVWVRTNHDRLVRMSSIDQSDHDQIKNSPLRLRTTNDWGRKDIRVWDVLSEVVRTNVIPSPRNPFAIDFEFLESLPLMQSFLATGAMLHFLQRMLSCSDHSYNSLVIEELHELSKRHFRKLACLTTNIPNPIIIDNNKGPIPEFLAMTNRDKKKVSVEHASQSRRLHCHTSQYM